MPAVSSSECSIHRVSAAIVRMSTYLRALILVFCVLCCLRVSIPGQEWRTVHPGVEYARVDHSLRGDPVKINLLRLDLTKVRIDVHHAHDKAIGVELTSSIAARHRAIAAINAGFFRLDNSEFAGDAAGVMAIDGELYSESINDRIAMVITNDTRRTIKIEFEHIAAYARILPVVVKVPETHGINRERKKSEMVLYSPRFGPTTLTRTGGTEIVLEDCRADNTCHDFKILRGAGNSAIPRNGYVLSIDTDRTAAQQDFLESLAKLKKKEDRWFLVEHYMRPFGYLYLGRKPVLDIMGRIPFKGMKTNTAVDIVGGVPQLIKSGKIDITWEQEKASRSFVEMRHPRTAVAKLKDGKFLMVTVDGRQPGVSVGMTLHELAAYLLTLGATDAMNLDGGGSTTMFLEGKVVNTPSDKEGERKVSDAILVNLRRKSK
jgi:hypothetical protein